jgi:hypothetical protein
VTAAVAKMDSAKRTRVLGVLSDYAVNPLGIGLGLVLKNDFTDDMMPWLTEEASQAGEDADLQNAGECPASAGLAVSRIGPTADPTADAGA